MFIGRVELKDRLKTAIELRGLGAQTVERLGSLARGSVGRILRGERTYPRPETIEKLSAVLQVSYAWLATGDGPMELDAGPIDDPYPGRADLRRTAYWRSLPADLQAEVMRAIPARADMSLEGWIGLIQRVRDWRAGATPVVDLPPPSSQSSDPPPAQHRARH